MDYPVRKRQRLKDYNYASGGAYFITMCTKNGLSLFCDIIDNRVVVNHAGRMVEARLRNMSRGNIFVEKYCVMPNHIHAILLLSEDGTTQGSFPTTISEAVQRFKTITTKLYIDGVKDGIYPPFKKKIWHKSMHDHIIRNQKSYEKIWAYIDTNPLKWELDLYHVKGEEMCPLLYTERN